MVGDIVQGTGCSRTLVWKNLVPEAKIVDGAAMTIRCAHGVTVLYPLTDVELEVGGRKMVVEAAISETLPATGHGCPPISRVAR